MLVLFDYSIFKSIEHTICCFLVTLLGVGVFSNCVSLTLIGGFFISDEPAVLGVSFRKARVLFRIGVFKGDAMNIPLLRRLCLALWNLCITFWSLILAVTGGVLSMRRSFNGGSAATLSLMKDLVALGFLSSLERNKME